MDKCVVNVPTTGSTDIVIPGSLVLYAYREAYLMLANAANEILPLVERLDCELHPDRLTEPLRRFDEARGLLDALGWQLPAWDAHIAHERRELLLELLSKAAATQADMIESARCDGADTASEREMARELAELTAYITALHDS
jgi:hypothetical protein